MSSTFSASLRHGQPKMLGARGTGQGPLVRIWRANSKRASWLLHVPPLVGNGRPHQYPKRVAKKKASRVLRLGPPIELRSAPLICLASAAADGRIVETHIAA